MKNEEYWINKWNEFTEQQNKRLDNHFKLHFKRDHKNIHFEGYHSIICDVWNGLECSCYDDEALYKSALKIANDEQYDVIDGEE